MIDAPRQRGFALIEVLIAAALLASAATAIGTVLAQHAMLVQQSYRDEVALQRAAILMSRVSLWSGDRLAVAGTIERADGLRIVVGRSGTSLFDVRVVDAAGRTLLKTTLYAEESRAQ